MDEINKSYGKEVIREVPLYYGQALMRAQIIAGFLRSVDTEAKRIKDQRLFKKARIAVTVHGSRWGLNPVGQDYLVFS